MKSEGHRFSGSECDANATHHGTAHLRETLAYNAYRRRLQEAERPAQEISPATTRSLRLNGTPLFPRPTPVEEAQDWQIDGPAGRLALRVLIPPIQSGVYFHIQGGGWVFGTPVDQEVELWRLARLAHLVVVSVSYRLAPEHPYPAAVDDCEHVARWLTEVALAEFGTERLLIGGRSAGAHLAVLTLLRLRNTVKAPLRSTFVGANLVYGAYDLSSTPSQRLAGDEGSLSKTTMAWFYDCFVPGTDPEMRRDPSISPLYADLRELPAALFIVGALDLLLDDTLFLEARWREAGNPTRLYLYAGGVHGFTAFPISIANDARDKQVEFLSTQGLSS